MDVQLIFNNEQIPAITLKSTIFFLISQFCMSEWIERTLTKEELNGSIIWAI